MRRTDRIQNMGLGLSLAALGLGCGTDDEPSGELLASSGATDAALESSDTGGTDLPPDGSGDDSTGTMGDDDEPPEEMVCVVGSLRPCDCPEGATGQEVCVDIDGTYSACGCPTDPDVYEEPVVPEPTFCGELECAAMVDEETEASAKPCCTEANACGGEAAFIFGDQCVERFGDPGDLTTDECPDEFPHFLDLEGCCMPQGTCGLSLDYINNWDVGCIERTEMMERLNAGSGLRSLLALVFFLGPVEVEYEAMGCTPP